MSTRTRKGPPSSRRRRCRRPWSPAHRTCGPLSATGSRLAPSRPGRAITIAVWRSPRGTPQCCDRTETYLKQRQSRACRYGQRRRPAPQRKDGSLRGEALVRASGARRAQRRLSARAPRSGPRIKALVRSQICAASTTPEPGRSEGLPRPDRDHRVIAERQAAFRGLRHRVVCSSPTRPDSLTPRTWYWR